MYSKRHLIEIFFTKLAFDLRSEASKTYLGYLWWVLEPALFVAVLYLVFGLFMNSGTENYVVFLVCGFVPFSWFSKSVLNSANSILVGRGLISQVAIPKPFFPVLSVSQDLVKELVVLLLTLLFLVGFGLEPGPSWMFVVFIVLAQFLLIVACALIAAAVVPFLPDFRFIIGTGMMLMMFASGIFYSYKQVLLEQHQSLFLLNPVANLIKNYRQVLMDHQQPDWAGLAWIGLGSAIVIFIMLGIYRRADTAFARVVVQ